MFTFVPVEDLCYLKRHFTLIEWMYLEGLQRCY